MLPLPSLTLHPANAQGILSKRRGSKQSKISVPGGITRSGDFLFTVACYNMSITMTLAAIRYVEQTPQGGWRISGTRVPLDSVIQSHLAGRSPQAIVSEFPALTLEQVHGAIAFYLHNRQELDQYLKDQQARWEQLRKDSEVQNKVLLDRLRTEDSK